MTNKICSDALYEKGLVHIATVGDATSIFNVPKGRGNVLGVQILLSNNVLADLQESTISLSVNGITAYDAIPLVKYCAQYQNSNNELVLEAAEGGIISISTKNTSAASIIVALSFLFRIPRK